MQILCLLPIFAAGSAYAVTCQSNEFEYNGECIENKFQITTTDEASAFVFKFQISAKGTFYVDWGDGNTQQITRSNTTITQYSHSFAAGQYTIKLGGLATEYNTSSSPYTPAIRFGEDANGAGGNSASNLYSISGSLSAIFPTIGSGEAARYRPHFNTVFRNCKNLTGTIPDDLFGRIVNGVYQGISGIPIGHMFNGTFYGCSGLTGSIPDTLFGREVNGTYYGISGSPMTYIFYGTFYGCSGLTGSIPENLFGRYINGTYYGISGTPSASIFQYTFAYCTGLSETDIDDPDNPGMKYAIPPNLFAGISGKPASAMFAQTFAAMSGLKGTIPKDLFKNISGAPAANMFITLFSGCTGLKGSIPGTLFAGISGAPATGMFKTTFSGCDHLTGAIPADLFSGISGAPASEMFYQTFSGCSGLTGPIPGNLFGGISGAPAGNMFYSTFLRCSGLTGTEIDDPDQPGYKYAIPPTLFSGITGSPRTNMFYQTFDECTGLTGTIPGNLFGGVVGAPADGMFYATFYKCTGLTGSIPGTLFSGLSGAPATDMFRSTFNQCSNLIGSIPGDLFAGVVGKPANTMFRGTFQACSKLTGPIPGNLFAGIIGKPAAHMFYYTFDNCTNLGKDTIGGTSMYYIPPELFAGIDKTTTATYQMNGVFNSTGLLTTCPAGTSQYITGFESYFSGKKSCTTCSVNYPNYDTTNDQCYAQITYIDSDNNTLLKTENVYYDANYPNGYTLPSYSPTKPDTVLDNWENGSGTVIAANDVLTGNQVLYSDWGFNCDSGRYFHIGNEQVCIAESKRTEHALVIQYDPEHTYYIHATPNSEHDYTINSSSIHKLKADYNGTIYNLHDASVYFSE